MRFTKTNIAGLISQLEKLERYYAYKYEVAKADVAIIVNCGHLHILISGKAKEKIHPSTIESLFIDEKTGSTKVIYNTPESLKTKS